MDLNKVMNTSISVLQMTENSELHSIQHNRLYSNPAREIIFKSNKVGQATHIKLMFDYSLTNKLYSNPTRLHRNTLRPGLHLVYIHQHTV